MKRLFLILWTALPFLAEAQTINESFMHNGVQRNYVLHIPANYSGATSTPLVLNFHGFGGNGGQQHLLSNFNSIADTAGFIVVSPTGTPLPGLGLNHWNVGGWTNASTIDDISFTATLIDTIAAKYNVDLSRVYATGLSNGGFFSHRLACELGHRIAAIASVAGTFTPQMQSNCTPSAPISVMQIHGTTDGIVPYNGTTSNGGMVAVDTVINYWINHNNCNTTPTVTNLPDINTNDGSTVEKSVYDGGNAGTTVELLKVINGGHNWPGPTGNMDIIASLEIWKFFSKYSNTAVGVTSVIKKPFKLYPNPVYDLLTISAESELFRITIYDAIGRKVFSDEINDTEYTTSLEGLNSGNYFYQLSTKNGFFNGKLLKK